MTRTPLDRTKKNFTSRQISGYRSQLISAINCSTDGAYAEVDLTTARNLVMILNQAIATEYAKEHPYAQSSEDLPE
jgi:hypothetical protein